jgi:D-lactate dehydrogenase
VRVLVTSARDYDRRFLGAAVEGTAHELTFSPAHLDVTSAVIAEGHEAVCPFVNDELTRPVLEELADRGVRWLALRSAGFNHVDLEAADELGIGVARVPAYSPYAVAEHTVALLLAVDRKLHRSWNRVREQNFSLDGLLGFDLRERTVGIVGTGKIGHLVARICRGFGCSVIGYDPYPSDEARDLGLQYVELEELLRRSDVISLHSPLTPETYHMLDEQAFSLMKDGVTIVNTSRGALIDTPALVEALKSGKVDRVALDVYEEEGDLFFEDLSDRVIGDDTFARLLTFPNVLVTAHQAFFTEEALTNIAETTVSNLEAFAAGSAGPNAVTAAMITGD